ncbi:MAG: helix-turn-helix transcriptional regulator [Actinomycetota bacterium]
MAPTTTLVPPRRLGALLRQARVAAGLDHADLARGSGLSVVELDDIEHGRRDLDEDTLTTLVRLYGVEDAGLVPARSQLVIDLDEGRIAVNRTDLDVDPIAGPDAVLARYLALVYRLRGLSVGTKLHLRDVDIEVLSSALSLAATDVENRLHRLIADETDVHRDQTRIRRQLLMPLVGVVVAATSVGTLVLVAKTDTAGQPAPSASTEVSTEIATPAVQESPAAVLDIGSGGAVEENPNG